MSESESESKPENESEKVGVVDRILDAIGPQVRECWHAPDGETIVSRAVDDAIHNEPVQSLVVVRDGDAVVANPTFSQLIEAWVRAAYRRETGRSIPPQALERAINDLHSRGVEGEMHDPKLRIAGDRERVIIDLGDSSHRVVDIDRDGWVIRPSRLDDRLVRRQGMLPLPTPNRTGPGLEEVRPLLNITDEQWPLVCAWLVCAVCPVRPWPILRIEGEQGSAKSTTTRVLRSIIDPHEADLRDAPTRNDEIAVACRSSWVVAYENLTGVPRQLSNTLCIVSTGGVYSTREFHRNKDEIIIRLGRPMILNGISDIVSRSDLADRCLSLQLRPIEGLRQRVNDGDIAARLEEMRPRLLGALADAVAVAIERLPEVKRMSDVRWPRMSEACQWATAAEPALGLKPGTILKAWQENRADTVDRDMSANPLYAAVLEIVERGGEWRCEPTEGFKEITNAAGRGMPPRGWPANAKAMSQRLNEMSPSLRAMGIMWSADGKSNGRRMWTLGRIR